MFVISYEPSTYEVTWTDGGFVVKCQQDDGAYIENLVRVVIEGAYAEELAKGTYMPTPELIEYHTARRLGVNLLPPEIEGEPGVVY